MLYRPGSASGGSAVMTTSKSEPAAGAPAPQEGGAPPETSARDVRTARTSESASQEPASIDPRRSRARHDEPESAKDNDDLEPTDDDDDDDDDDLEPTDDDDDDDDLEPTDDDDDDLEPTDDDDAVELTDDDTERREATNPRVPRRPAPKPWGHLAPPTLRFVAAILLLDTMVNLRFPLEEPAFWYLVPSTDIAIILLNFALMGLLNGAIPRGVRWLIVAWLFLVRLLRLGDGIKGLYFEQRFNAYSDLGLIPDGLRFLHSTRPIWEIVLGSAVALALLAGLAFACNRALLEVEDYLRDRRQLLVAGGLFAITYVSVAATDHGVKFDEFYSDGLAASAMSRVEEEVSFVWNVKSRRAGYGTLITETEAMLDGLPSDLAKLHGANVYLILVESYGRTMFELPEHVQASKATYDTFEKELGDAGFTLASGIVNSTTYGGQSWLAHATLDTGIPVRSQLEFEIVSARQPKSIATFFRRAGYRTVLAQPNTMRPITGKTFYDFDAQYLNKDFGYRGPDYAWATMPDQYVLDFLRRREVEPAKGPLFLQYVLVSSHAPWSRLPRPLDDWSKLGDGSIFKDEPVEEFPIEWPHFEHATAAYGKSILYDLDVIRRYLLDYVKDGSLVIILGDHQPVAEVNGDTAERGVPVHVLSRNPELVRPLLVRGYRPGVRPNLRNFALGLETLLPNLLVDYSSERKPN